MSQTLLESHYGVAVKALLDGKVVPLLGAGVNLCGRPAGERWTLGTSLPSGRELAAHLAESFGYPEGDPDQELVRVSQYVALMAGEADLYDELRKLFDLDYAPTALHRLLAGLPGLMRAHGLRPRYQLVVTTNYDDALERAFREAEEPYDLVVYLAEGEQRGSFLHCPHDGVKRIIPHGRANEFHVASDDRGELERTVIMKIHGAVDRESAEHDSFVITEDDYIEYLARSDVSKFVPANLVDKLRNSNILFLGYSMRDWNLRVILHRIWGEQKFHSRKAWSIQVAPDALEQQFWNARGVLIFDVPLEEYVQTLGARLEQAARARAGT
jgi:hypothetical protein